MSYPENMIVTEWRVRISTASEETTEKQCIHSNKSR